jgi:uncharacterized protein (TIGR02246 family)
MDRAVRTAAAAAAAVSRSSRKADEAAIRELIDDLVSAIEAKDMDAVMSVYSSDLVAFDVVPPLQYAGAHAYMKPWRELFERCRNPIRYELRDLDITVGDDVAFSHSLNRISETMADGHKTDLWLRCSAGYRKANGAWRIAHVHVSAPVELGSGQALLDLKP